MAGITSEGDYKPHLFPVSNLILGISRKGDNHLMGQTDGQILRAHYMHIIITHTHNITLCAQQYSKSFSITSLTLSLCLFFRWENCSTGSKRPAQIPTKRDRDLNRYTVPCVHPAKRDSTPATNRAAGSDPTIMWRWQMKLGIPGPHPWMTPWGRGISVLFPLCDFESLSSSACTWSQVFPIRQADSHGSVWLTSL